jgi:hypothetical protein
MSTCSDSSPLVARRHDALLRHLDICAPCSFVASVWTYRVPGDLVAYLNDTFSPCLSQVVSCQSTRHHWWAGKTDALSNICSSVDDNAV